MVTKIQMMLSLSIGNKYTVSMLTLSYENLKLSNVAENTRMFPQCFLVNFVVNENPRLREVAKV